MAKASIRERWEIVMFGLNDPCGESTTTTPEEACEMLETAAGAFSGPYLPRVLRDCAAVIRRLAAELAKGEQ